MRAAQGSYATFQGRASCAILIPNLLPAHHSSHQRPCTEMTHRDRKLHQQGGLLFWEQPLRRIKGSQLLTLEEGTGAQRRALVQEAVSLIFFLKPQAWRRVSFLFPSPRTLPPTPRAWASSGGFSGTASNHPTQRESAEFPSEPHVRWGLGVAKEQSRLSPPRLRDFPELKTGERQQKNTWVNALRNSAKETFLKYS